MTPRIVLPALGPQSLSPQEAPWRAGELRAGDSAELAPLSRLFSAGGKLYAAGGGGLVEISPGGPAGWRRIPLPPGDFPCGGLDGWPWFVASDGRVMKLAPGSALRDIVRLPSLVSAELHPLPEDRILSVPQRRWFRTLRALHLPDCTIGWRRRGQFAVRAALGDVVLLSPAVEDLRITIAVDASTGEELWRYTVPPEELVGVIARVNDWIWLSVSGQLLVALDARTGAESARLSPGPMVLNPLLDHLGRAHLLSPTHDHWLADLRDGSIERLYRAAASAVPSSPQPMLALHDGTLLTRDRSGSVHRLGAGPAQLVWRDPEAMPMAVLPYPSGLAILLDPAPAGPAFFPRRVQILQWNELV